MFIRPLRNEADIGPIMRDRRLALGRTQEEAEHRIDLTRGHIGKVENCTRPWGKRVFRMTFTMECMLEYYGLTLLVVDVEPDKLEALLAMIEHSGVPAAAVRRRSKRCPLTMDLFEDCSDMGVAA